MTSRAVRAWGRCLVVLAVVALAAPAQSSPRPSRLVFTGGDGQVYVFQLGRAEPSPLTQFVSGQAYVPEWSPDSRDVVYVAECTDVTCPPRLDDVVRADVRSRASRVIASVPGVFVHHVSWSPDGRRVAFDTVTPGPYGQVTLGRTMVVDADGSDLRTVALGLAPSWAPDSQHLALTDWTSGALVVVDVASGSSRTVSPEGVYTGSIGVVKNYASQPAPPAWSPDGRWLAFSGVRSATHAVVDDAPRDWHAWVVRADGTRARRLHDAGHVADAPSWSPDSTQLVYDDAAGIAVERLGDRRARRIATTRIDARGGTAAYFASWSPRGSLIAFVRQSWSSTGPGPVVWDLVVVRPDGRGTRVVTHLSTGALSPLRWAPDSAA